MQLIGSTCKLLTTEEIFWLTNSNAFMSGNSVQADCLEKVVDLKTGKNLYQKGHLSPLLPPKVIPKSVWQVQHEDQVEQESTGRPVADQVTITPEVGLSFQGVPREELQQDEENSGKQNV